MSEIVLTSFKTRVRNFSLEGQIGYFFPPETQLTFEAITSELPDFEGTNVCEEAQDLILRLLAKDARERIGLEEALSHPFLARCGRR